MKTCNKCNIYKPINCFTVKEKLTGKLFNQCKDCRNIYSRSHSKLPSAKEKRRLQKIEYWKVNKEKLQPKRTIYIRERRRSSEERKIENRARVTLNNLLNGKQKTTSKNFGCDVLSLRAHIEKKFKENMAWSNYGEWEIDHIIPVSKFDQEKEFEQCWHFSNLQPLWSSENKYKSAS